MFKDTVYVHFVVVSIFNSTELFSNEITNQNSDRSEVVFEPIDFETRTKKLSGVYPIEIVVQ